MPKYLRMISQRRWLTDRSEFSWLEEDDIPAEILTDFKAEDNNISLWIIDDHLAGLDRVIAALGTNGRDKVGAFDYLLVDTSAIDEQDFAIVATPGATRDAGISELHRDVSELSGRKLLQLAAIFYSNFGMDSFERVKPKELGEKIVTAVENGHFVFDELPPDIKKYLTTKLKFRN